MERKKIWQNLTKHLRAILRDCHSEAGELGSPLSRDPCTERMYSSGEILLKIPFFVTSLDERQGDGKGVCFSWDLLRILLLAGLATATSKSKTWCFLFHVPLDMTFSSLKSNLDL